MGNLHEAGGRRSPSPPVKDSITMTMQAAKDNIKARRESSISNPTLNKMPSAMRRNNSVPAGSIIGTEEPNRSELRKSSLQHKFDMPVILDGGQILPEGNNPFL